MELKKQIAIDTINNELKVCYQKTENYNWHISEFDQDSLKFHVEMCSVVDNEEYKMEFLVDQYPELPPLIEFIDIKTGARGVKSAYPKNKGSGKGFFHGNPCICNPCSRKAYKSHNGPHGDWNMLNWRQNQKVGSLVNIHAILTAIHARINDPERYDGRMA